MRIKNLLEERASQSRYGRAVLHVACAILGGHWSWHLGFVVRDLPFRQRACAVVGGAREVAP